MNAVDEIKHLYHNATKTTIQRDLTRAIALLKTLATEDEREGVAVYMDGLSQMRSEWGVRPAPTVLKTSGGTRAKVPAGRGKSDRSPATRLTGASGTPGRRR